MSKRRRWPVRVGIGVVVIGLLGLVLVRARAARAKTDLPVAQATVGEFLVTVHCRGALMAQRTTQLRAPQDVQDLQIVWLAPMGSPVKEGDPVVKFDPSKSQQELREKKVALDQAQASLDQAVADARIVSDQDKLDLATAQYERDKARLEASKKAIVSSMNGEKSAIDLGLAEEKIKLQQATMGMHKASADAKIASQRTLRDNAAAELARAQKRLSQLVLTSPSAGVVNLLANRQQGWMNSQPYKVGDKVSAGVSVAEIPDLSTLVMEAKVDETDRGRIADGDDVVLHVDAFPEKNIAARLASISLLTESDFTDWGSARAFRAYAKPNSADLPLRPGMNGAADIVESRIPNAVHIPAKALFTERGNPIVYKKAKNGFERQPVEVIAKTSTEVAVKGVAAGSTLALSDPTVATADQGGRK